MTEGVKYGDVAPCWPGIHLQPHSPLTVTAARKLDGLDHYREKLLYETHVQ